MYEMHLALFLKAGCDSMGSHHRTSLWPLVPPTGHDWRSLLWSHFPWSRLG
jgi:hypothetical protein